MNLQSFLESSTGEVAAWVSNLAARSPPAVVELPSSSLYDNVGAEETLSEIRSLVEGDEAPVIGIYGMGGIGKTTLLKAINNEFLHRGSSQFDLVIWHPTDRVNTLRRALSQRKFLLLLDDLWEKLDLGAVGVPFSSSSDRNGSKIVFTTRLVEVCNRMDAEWKVQVPLLDQARSWELFCQKLGRGEDQWDPSVRSQAEDVCKKCGGLPITLITVGRAMAGATTLGEWKDALKDLEGIPPGLGDMEKKVLESLKFSFDRLEDKSARERREGNIFLVNPSEWLTCVPKPERWAEARRISLMYNRISKLPKKPRCRNLQTLLLNDNDNNFHPEEIRLKFPLGFFQFMRRLRVLDLSYRSIRLLPSGIGSLVELRFLDLSGTLLESLPMEVGRLTKLRQLRLEHVSYLTSIPREAVLSLKGLQSLNLLESDYVFTGDWEDDGSDSGSAHDEGQLSLRDLEGMGQLTELGVSIRGMTQRGMEDLQKSHRLCASIRFLSLEYVGISSFDLSAFLEVMKGLRKLTINFSPDLEDLVFNKNQLSELEELSLFNLSRATVHWKDGNVFVTGPTTAGIFKTFGSWIFSTVKHWRT
ncbi:unnamed protein product [Spirodela intermedia]|uniref:Uncharacterized protein n=1 Tax=Spirodela intermedia TaxID=51605 RepID=A0A7I8JRW6_SPIIN|nr:unnamed protein product [Spirodela intermedia]CAA6672485.1 unnamed protein product [Spirodela intermedia]